MGCANSKNSSSIEPVGVPTRVQEVNDDNMNLNESNNNTAKVITASKGVAFEIEFERSSSFHGLPRTPPKKFTRLAPLSNAPKFTADQLEEKIKQADENRQRELDRKKATGRRSQRLRAEIQRAREAERATQQQRELETKLQAAEEARGLKQSELDKKKQLREERAKLVRDRARRKKEGGDELDYEIERDDAFNVDENSWSEGDNFPDTTSDYHTGNNSRYDSGTGDRLYADHDSASKTLTFTEKPLLFGPPMAESIDYSFQRNNVAHMVCTKKTVEDDGDFYDT